MSEDIAVVYIDNSNTFISTQKYSSKKFGYRPHVQDVCRRIHYDRLIEAACINKRLLPPIKLYGSEPPPLDEVLSKIKNTAGVDVDKYQRDEVLNKETRTDTALVADAVRQIITLNRDKDELSRQLKRLGVRQMKDKYFILFSGDADMFPVVKKAIKYGWIVEIWAYRSLSLAAKDLRFDFPEDVETGRVKIVNMEDHFEDVTFNEWSYSGSKESLELKRRSLVIMFQTPTDSHRKNLISTQIVSIATKLFKIPIQGCFIDEDTNQKFFLVFRADEYAMIDKQRTRIFNYKLHIEDNIPTLKESLDACEELPSCEEILPFIEFLRKETGVKPFKCRKGLSCSDAHACIGNHTVEEDEYFAANRRITDSIVQHLV